MAAAENKDGQHRTPGYGFAPDQLVGSAFVVDTTQTWGAAFSTGTVPTVG